RLRDERLKQAVRALEESRALERKTSSDLALAIGAREEAEAARRQLSQTRADVLDFIESEEWLRSRSLLEDLAAQRLRKAQAQLDRAICRVAEARVKVRQLEQLQKRLAEQRRRKQA